jgi:hypothetical protein
VFLSEVVIGEKIGLEEVEEELWSVQLYARELARYDAGTSRLHG